MLGTQQTALYGNVMNSVKEIAVTKTPVEQNIMEGGGCFSLLSTMGAARS